MKRGFAWLLLGLLVLLGLSRLRFDAEPLALLPQDVPSIAGLRLHQELFAGSRELLVTVDAPAPEAAAALAEAIALELRGDSNRVAAARWRMPLRESLAENIAWMWMQRPESEWQALEARWSPGRLRADLAAARERLATSLDPTELGRLGYDPLGLLTVSGTNPADAGLASEDALFASPDGTFRLVMVEPLHPRMAYREATAWMTAVRERVEGVRRRFEEPDPGNRIRVAYTGGPAFLTEVANGMESDLKSSVLCTLVVICLLFWTCHRSLRPLGLLVSALGLTLGVTLALGGLLLGTLNVISCGFGAVMMGLVVDYGLVGYQELLAHPGASPAQLRRAVFPGIGWSAATTAGTFLSLGFAGLPGLFELGVLTAIGLLVGAGVMLFWFLPRASRVAVPVPPPVPDPSIPSPPPSFRGRRVGIATGLVVAACVLAVTLRGWPRTEGGAGPLRPRKSAAYEAMATLQERMGRTRPTTWLLVSGTDLKDVHDRLESLVPILERLRVDGTLRSFRVPTDFWPDPGHAQSHRTSAQRLAGGLGTLRAEISSAGFSPQSLALAEEVLDHWRRWSASEAAVPTWPENEGARWLAGLVSGRRPDGTWVGLASVEAEVENVPLNGLPPGVQVAGWDRLGPDLLERVRGRVAVLTLAILGVLVLCLWLAFRRWTEVFLSLAALGLSFGILIAVMAVLGARWNLLNLVAIPLLLGTSVDSAIHVQLALRRHGGHLRALWRTTGLALLLCAGANVAGFGSLAWSSNAGLASLDIVCAGGVVCVLGVMLLLLPFWWRALHPGATGTAGRDPLTDPPVAGPSQLYGGAVWRAAGMLARRLPRFLLVALARAGAATYSRLRPDRLDTVVENLLPLVGGQPGIARRIALANYGEFAEKLVDLWRHEAGSRGAVAVEPEGDWTAFRDALAAGRGVLLVTPHLGNWELGGPMLARFGVRPLVLSAPEPDSRLTALRAEARSRYGVDTLVVGTDPFAFVEVIRRLQDGGVVALLVDRPMSGSGVTVEFFGRPYRASVAAAELARATGCCILPVYVVREGGGHRAHALPAVEYDRSQLGSREARQALSGRILRVFEPILRQFPGQWFHFVPVWRDPDP